jgi:signal transduction histidine kinase
MKIRTKILLLAILPLVLAIFAINAIVYLINQSQIATKRVARRTDGG